jgi:hypothetical protein
MDRIIELEALVLADPGDPAFAELADELSTYVLTD